MMAALSLGSRCSAGRWANPEGGIPPYPGGPPAVGYVETGPRRPAHAEEADAAASTPPDAAPESAQDADPRDAGQGAADNPY